MWLGGQNTKYALLMFLDWCTVLDDHWSKKIYRPVLHSSQIFVALYMAFNYLWITGVRALMIFSFFHLYNMGFPSPCQQYIKRVICVLFNMFHDIWYWITQKKIRASKKDFFIKPLRGRSTKVHTLAFNFRLNPTRTVFAYTHASACTSACPPPRFLFHGYAQIGRP